MLIDHYYQKIEELLRALRQDEGENIRQAALLLKEQISRDRLIHVFGVSGHSVIGCEEFFWRAGGLSCVNPLFDLSLNLSGGGLKSTQLERVSGIGDKVIASLQTEPGDLLILTSIYGMNAATIDAALEGRRKGMKIVAITSRHHAQNTPADFVARHPSRQNLADLSDVTIDNHVPHGDCLMEIPGIPQKTGPCSTILVSFCVQWLVMETIRLCTEASLPVPVWQSANTEGGDQINATNLDRYLSRVKAL